MIVQQSDVKLRTKQADNNQSIPRISSEELLKGQSRLIIEHQGSEYILNITRQGKLILTK
ncbi:MAG: hemin uptake protein HemP [Candidatus Thiodiazotropha sp. (ex Ctena orbiculata)]|nr:hemin uptake protein HemP [Candidatus Thiodiazotropha taylori]